MKQRTSWAHPVKRLPFSNRLNLLEFDNKVVAAEFLRKKKIGQNTYEFKFALHRSIKYVPGQYVWLNLPQLRATDKKGARRAMSIVYVGAGNKEISIAMRISDSSFKKAALRLTSGQQVEIIGPNGSSFCLPENGKQSVVLIAGGTGIAPFVNLVQNEEYKKSKRTIHLFYTDEGGNSAPYLGLLNKIKLNNYHLKFSQVPFAENDFAGIHESMRAIYYLSGPQKFVDFYYRLLSGMGIAKSSMRFENFYPSNDVVELMQQLFRDGDAIKPVPGDTKLAIQRRDILLSAIQSSSHHIVITDINGVIVLANKAAERITGFSFYEMEGQTPRLWGGLMPVNFYSKLWNSKLHGLTIDEEIVNRRKDGSLYLVMSHISPIKNKHGKAIGFIGTEEDITLNRQKEIESNTIAEQLESTLLGIAEGLIITDGKGRIQRVNAAACSMLGYSQKELVGKNANDAIEMLDSKEVPIPKNERITSRVISSSAPVVTEDIANSIYYRKKDGTKFPVYVAASPVIENSRMVGSVEIFRDISRDKEIDIAKSEFVSLASHQLRTPLSAINWNAELLMGGDAGKLTADQANFVKEIYSSSQRMVDLVRSLLNVSRIELGTLGFDPSPQNVNELIKAIMADERLLRDKEEISVKLNLSKIPRIPVDPRLVTLLVQNLGSNAIKYSKHGGEIIVTSEYLANPSKRKNFRKKGIKIPSVYLCFKDSGIGIPKEQQKNIFSKMFRADNAQEQVTDGNGLGLYMVKGIVESIDGKIWFESSVKNGTSFHVLLPLEGLAKKDSGIKLLDV